MITELRLENVRIYDEREWIFPLSNLTILCGTNSAGKSTVLKCLLLIRQNLLFRDPSFTPLDGPRLRFSNSFSDLGNFRSFVSHNDTARELHLGISVESEMDPDNYKILAPDLALPQLTEQSDKETEPQIPYKLDADFYFGVKQFAGQRESASRKQLDLRLDDSEEDSASEHRAILKQARFNIRSAKGDSLANFDLVRRPTENKTGLNDYFLRMRRELLDSGNGLLSYEYIEDLDPAYGLIKVFMPGLYPDRAFGRPRLQSVVPEELSHRFWPLPPYMDEAFSDLRAAVNRIVYLGPLRAPAKRYYPIQADSALQADVTGELLPFLLRDRMNTPVYAAVPMTHLPNRCRLVEALNSWLFFMRTGTYDRPHSYAREIKIDSMQDVLVELGIKSVGGTETHALADSGFGYSQLLPILVRGLMLPLTGTLLIEQPELHLNPALQVRLSDFLVAMASLGKQIIIETHSEHIVNAIRAIAAEKIST